MAISKARNLTFAAFLLFLLPAGSPSPRPPATQPPAAEKPGENAPAGSAARADAVKVSPTFHQRVEGFTLALSIEEMGFLLDNLPYAARLLTEFEIHPLTIERRGEVYHAKDRKGLEGTFRLVDLRGSLREYGGQGSFKNDTIGVVTADVVATIRYEPVNPRLISNDLEFWVLVNNEFLDFLCRLFRPMLKGILKNNVEYLVATTQKLALTIRERELDMFVTGQDNPR